MVRIESFHVCFENHLEFFVAEDQLLCLSSQLQTVSNLLAAHLRGESAES